jgi:hypothetical protein
MTIGRPIRSWIATASSPIEYWKPPSPTKQTTARSGRPIFAPIAAGRPKPSVP